MKDGMEAPARTRTRRAGGAAGAAALSPLVLVLRYAAFAALAMMANLGAQRLVLSGLGQGEKVAFGWAPRLFDWVLHDLLGAVAAGGGWRAEWTAPAALSAAIAVGTVTGLALKYLLDKRWIFDDRSRGAKAHARRFTLYAAMGLATTAIFWGAEAGAWALWGTDFARESGAAIGLVIGYMVKYRLDRRFVFTPGAA